MIWELHLRNRVKKALQKFPGKDKERIVEALRELRVNPYFGDIAKLEGREQVWRRRIGAFRIFYELIPKDRVIYVFHMERRTSKTY